MAVDVVTVVMNASVDHDRKEARQMPRGHIENRDQYEALKDKGMSKERAARIANDDESSEHGGEQSHSGSGDPSQGGTHAQKVKAGRKGGEASH